MKRPQRASIHELIRIESKVDSGKKLTIEEAMTGMYEKPCRRIAPLSPEARGFKAGSVLIRKRSVAIVCELNATGLEHERGLVHIIVSGPSKASFGFYPNSRFILPPFHIKVCSEEELEEEKKHAHFINIWIDIERVERRIQVGGVRQRSGGGSLRQISCPEEAGLIGGSSGRRLRRSLQSLDPFEPI